MEVTWEVEDGYVGKSRPQTTYIDDDELRECDNYEDALELIEEYVRDDFAINISWSFSEFERIADELIKILESKTDDDK